MVICMRNLLFVSLQWKGDSLGGGELHVLLLEYRASGYYFEQRFNLL